MRTGYLVLAAAVLIAFWRLETPAPKAADAPPEVFSAARAFGDIAAIAQRPHPAGSADHERVKTHLVQRLIAMGFIPQLQSERATVDGIIPRTVSAPVTNVVAVLQGKDSSLPAVLIISHYDSVPDSPGAADDSTAVAASLEIARALKAGPTLPRDVVFLFTDGEEIGLVGATAFFRDNPLAGHVGVVINFEARGDAGLAAMFETGPNNAQTVSLWAAKVPRPSASSLSRTIYKKMPNGTDFTPAIAGGLPGLNFAFIGDEAAYHSPLATPVHLSLGSVQHIGDAGLAAARAFAETIPAQEADSIYSDVLGFFTLQYGFTAGWILFGFTALLALFAIATAQAACAYSWWRGLAGMVSAIVLPVAALLLAGLSFTGVEHFLRLAHFDFLLAGAAALALGAAFLGATLFARKHLAAVWQWFLLLNLALAFVLQRSAPEASFFLVWPLLAASIIALIRFTLYRGRDEIVPGAIASVIAIGIVAQTACSAVFLFTAVGADLPVVIFLPLLSILPVLLLLPGKPAPASLHVAVIAAGAVLFAYGRFAPPTEERPAPSLIRHVTDLDSGKAYVADYLNAGDRWTKAALGEDARRAPLPWSPRGKYWWAPANPVTVPKAEIVFARAGSDLMIVVRPQPGAISATLTIRASEGLGEGALDGAKTAALGPGLSHDVQYYAPGPDGFIWTVPAPKSGTVEVKLTTLYPGWPTDAAQLPPLPANKMPFGNSQTTETVTRKVWKP